MNPIQSLEAQLPMLKMMYGADNSLKGEFVRQTLAEESLDDGEKEAIIVLGLKALNGEELT